MLPCLELDELSILKRGTHMKGGLYIVAIATMNDLKFQSPNGPASATLYKPVLSLRDRRLIVKVSTKLSVSSLRN
jgi:hypothetical protein